MEAAVEKLLELEELYQRKIEYMTIEQLVVESAIASLDSLERQLLRYRYIDGMKWEEICIVLDYSWPQIHRIHAAALRKLEAE